MFMDFHEFSIATFDYWKVKKIGLHEHVLGTDAPVNSHSYGKPINNSLLVGKLMGPNKDQVIND